MFVCFLVDTPQVGWRIRIGHIVSGESKEKTMHIFFINGVNVANAVGWF